MTVSSCMSKLAQISRAKHAFNSDLLVIIINALVFSKLYYCSSVWCNTSASNMQKLQLIQNFAAWIISGATKFEHITPSLKNLGWLPIKKQVYLRDAIFVFKCMMGYAPTYLECQLPQEGRYLTVQQETHNNLTFLYLKPLLARDHSTIG